ncbi:hypothetical protein DH2020_009838 [Rehmannia glutinosa]|uniref:Bidirectional sugar transporter SWEET n=1 Tax=Rehmannia glutinosa TaxID=99300 RepID=A0ABR0X9U5_REHGL
MEEKFRLAVGVMGNAASMLLYAAPMLTFSRVIRKKSTEGFSCVPYILALFNCSLYTWYGLPVVSYKWENFPVVTINGLGILLEISFILIYFYFASADGKATVIELQKKVAMLTIPVILVSCLIAILSAFVFHDHRHRKALVGSVGLVASVAMYGSPLVAVSPNLVGSPLGVLQLVLYCIYRKRRTMEQPQKWDLENDCNKPMQHMKVTDENEDKPIQYLKANEEKEDDKAKQPMQPVVTNDAMNGKK